MKPGSRIRWIAYLLALAGAALLTTLIVREGAARVLAALAQGSWAVPVVAAINIPRLFSDGASWLALVPRASRPRFLTAVWIRWVGGSINEFLPTARLGGDILTARLAAIRGGLPPTLAAAIAAVIVTVSVTMRILVIIGALLLIAGLTGLAHLYIPTFAAGLTALIAVIGLYLIQRFGLFRLTAGLISWVKTRLQIVERASLPPSSGRAGLRRTSARPNGAAWSSLILNGANFDDTLRALYARLPALLMCALFWIFSWLIDCVQTWLALLALGIPTTFVVALIVETAGQSVRSIFFIVPAGLGVFEAGMLMICNLFGIPGDIALALSVVRRAREALFCGPGLIIWQFVEARRLFQRVNDNARP